MGEHADPRRIAKNESLRREDNERIEAHNAAVNWNPPYASWECECTNEDCAGFVMLSISEYDTIRSNPTHFIVVPSDEHVAAHFERVVERTGRYWVVEKVGEAAEMSEELDASA